MTKAAERQLRFMFGSTCADNILALFISGGDHMLLSTRSITATANAVPAKVSDAAKKPWNNV